MKYIVDITPQQAQTIQHHLEKGSYGSLSQFVSTAIQNQLALEENEINELIPYKPQEITQRMQTAISKTEDYSFERYSLKNLPDSITTIAAPEYKDLVYASQGIKENDAWIWGQINKIFPVKVGLRILHYHLSKHQPVELNEFLETVANEAASIGIKLREYEKTNNKIRGEKISPALPSSDEKSRNRYKFQFMVYLRKDKKKDGAMSLMRFCNVYEEKKKLMIGLTEAGLKFSLIHNPVLDGHDLERSLSEEECSFYINHSSENIKGEYSAIRWMLEQIEAGKTDRDSLSAEIRKVFGKTWEATDAVIDTQRSGITARMTELGLIEKQKDGIRVKYKVSKTGEALFL